MKIHHLFMLTTLALSMNTFAATAQPNAMDEFDPSSPDAMKVVEEMTAQYEESGNKVMEELFEGFILKSSCIERGCKVFIDVNKATQLAELYIDGDLANTWKVSTAKPGKITKNFNGIISSKQFRIFDAKTSTTYKIPAGQSGYIENGKDLGNMPYAVFYHGPYAFHGTTAIPKLGTPASAGCVRLHPDNAKKFNRAVRAHGRTQTWVTIN